MRSLPLGKCYIAPDKDDQSEVTVFVTRNHPAGSITLGAYLIDKYCCGIKNAFFKFSIAKSELYDMILHYKHRMGIKEIPYVEAHNLIYGALEYAEGIGIAPHKDFDDAQYILAEDNEDIPLIEYEFGHDGRPYLISSKKSEIEYYKRLMLKVLNPEDFDVLLTVPAPIDRYSVDDDDDDDYDDDSDDYDDEQSDKSLGVDIIIHSDDGSDGFSIKALGDLTKDQSIEIKFLDPLRKVAYFTIMLEQAKSIGSKEYGLDAFIEATERALNNYHKYEDVAFGESAVKLHNTVKNFCKIMQSPNNIDTTFLNKITNFCIGYNIAVKQVNLLQKGYLKSIIYETENQAQNITEIMSNWIDIMLSYAKAKIDAEKNPDSAKISFYINRFEAFTDKWRGRLIRSHVKQIKAGFISKDPSKYYKQKMREAVNTNFTSEEDFMGLITSFNNLVVRSFRYLNEGLNDQAFYILYNIIVFTLWKVYDNSFDKWLVDEDIYKNLKAMLSNAVNILATMIDHKLVDRNTLISIQYDIHDLAYTYHYDEKYIDLIDLHPITYQMDMIIFSQESD